MRPHVRPSLPTRDDRRHKTCLYAILDDASRLVCHAQFYFARDLESLKDCFKQAFLKQGIPKPLYVDNARIFRSKQLLAVAAQIGFHLSIANANTRGISADLMIRVLSATGYRAELRVRRAAA